MSEYAQFVGLERRGGHWVAKFKNFGEGFVLNQASCEDRLRNLKNQSLDHEQTASALVALKDKSPMSYQDDVARIAQQAADDYPGEEARDDRYIFIEQEIKKMVQWLYPSTAEGLAITKRRGDIQDAVERLLEENGE